MQAFTLLKGYAFKYFVNLVFSSSNIFEVSRKEKLTKNNIYKCIQKEYCTRKISRKRHKVEGSCY